MHKSFILSITILTTSVIIAEAAGVGGAGTDVGSAAPDTSSYTSGKIGKPLPKGVRAHASAKDIATSSTARVRTRDELIAETNFHEQARKKEAERLESSRIYRERVSKLSAEATEIEGPTSERVRPTGWKRIDGSWSKVSAPATSGTGAITAGDDAS